MPLTKPNQEFFENLEGHGACLDWTTHDLIEIAMRIEHAGLTSEASVLLEMSKDLREWREIFFTFSDEVREGLIIRREP